MDQTAAYRRLKQTIDASHPRGWFVAVADDKVIGAAADFHDLERSLRAQGREPQQVLVVAAGEDYPEDVIIFG